MQPDFQNMPAQEQGENPFLDIVNNGQLGGDGVAQAMAGGTSQPGQPEVPPEVPYGITQPGQRGDQTTKPILQAMSSLEQFITASSDREDIATIKAVLQALSGVLQKNHQAGFPRVPFK